MNLDKLGWVVAAGVVGAMFGMGFQATAPKFAVVDMQKVFSDADFTASGSTELQEYAKPRIAVLQFLRQNLPMSPDDARKYAELSQRPLRNASDDIEIKRIEADAQSATSNRNALLVKPEASLTADDHKQMQDFSSRAQQNQAYGQQLEEKMGQDIDQKKLELHDKAMEQVRKTVGDVAKKQGYSVVFSSDAAPYAANDITPDALKVVKK
jgi:Skp family chaperone for outer membrane proteins